MTQFYRVLIAIIVWGIMGGIGWYCDKKKGIREPVFYYLLGFLVGASVAFITSAIR